MIKVHSVLTGGVGFGVEAWSSRRGSGSSGRGSYRYWLPLFATLAVFSSPSVTFAQSHGPESCAPVSEALERLACYDAIFRTEANAPMTPSAWEVSATISPISGRTNVRLELRSEEDVPADYGSATRARLELRCEENVTSAMFSFGGNYMSEVGTYGEISYRVGGAEALTIKGRASADNKLLGLPDGASAIPFLRRLLAAETLLVQANPVNRDGTKVTVHFSIAGIADAIVPLRQACGW